MSHVYVSQSPGRPSFGTHVETQCGKRLPFGTARQGDPREADCPDCQRGIAELEQLTRGHENAVPGLVFYIVEDERTAKEAVNTDSAPLGEEVQMID